MPAWAWALAGWLLLSVPFALLVGRGIWCADRPLLPHPFRYVHNRRMTHATTQPITPVFIGGGELVHALQGEHTQADVRGAGIELDTFCGARRRGGSRSMLLPGITVKPGVSITCRRCERTMQRGTGINLRPGR